MALAINPRDRQDWALENALSVAFVAALVLFRHRLPGHSLNRLFGWDRNHYDRLVHFSYGLLLAYPIRQILTGVAGVRGIWSYYLPFAVTSSTSADYELIEWGAATVFGGDLGIAYLGTQGDIWDARKDMALAAFGALLSMILLAIRNAWPRDA